FSHFFPIVLHILFQTHQPPHASPPALRARPPHPPPHLHVPPRLPSARPLPHLRRHSQNVHFFQRRVALRARRQRVGRRGRVAGEREVQQRGRVEQRQVVERRRVRGEDEQE